MADDNHSGGSFTLGLVLGGIIGALAATLLAPKTGFETRSDLAERSQAWRSRADEMAANMRERVGPSVDMARERIAPAVDGVRTRFGYVPDPVSAVIPDAQGGVDLNGQDAGAEGEASASEEQV